MVDADNTPTAVVKRLVKATPRGRAATYGAVGRVAAALGRPIGGARTVAWIIAALKGADDTPWHRVVGAGGVILLPGRRGAFQAGRLLDEGVRVRAGRLDPSRLLDEFRFLSLLSGRPRPRRRVRPSAGR